MKILILETSDIGATYTADAVKALGYKPLFLANLSNYQADTRRQLMQHEYIDCDTTSSDFLVQTITANKIANIIGIVTFLDSRLVVATELAHKLQVAGLDSAILQLKDKSHVQKLIPQYSPPTISFKLSEFPKDNIEQMLLQHNKIIIKPTLTAGAIGVEIINSVDQLKDIEIRLAHADLPQFLDNQDWLAQAYLNGPLYSVEGFVKKGEITILGISDRLKIGKTESQIKFPVDKYLHENVLLSVKTALDNLISISNFKNGYFHIEFIQHNNQAYIIDANIGRLGGGSVGAQIAESFNCLPRDFYAHAIDIGIFNGSKVSEYIFQKERTQTQGILYGVETECFLQDISLPNLGNCKHFQLLDCRTRIPAMGSNNWSWLGILSGPEQEVQQLIKKIQIRTEAGYVSPKY